MKVMHFKNTQERLAFLRAPRTEVKPKEVKKADIKFEEKPKKKKAAPKKKATPKKKEEE